MTKQYEFKKTDGFSFLNDLHYKTYLKGKKLSSWDQGLNWSLAENDTISEEHRIAANRLASLSAHVEVLGMANAAELLTQTTDFALRLGLGQAVNDEARHAELFAKYATLTGGLVDCSSTQDKYAEHFASLSSFDEVFLSHVFLENS